MAKRGVGYRVGQVIYFSLAFFLCAAGLRSVLLSVFFPKTAPHAAVDPHGCVDAIHAMQVALTDYQADRINGEAHASSLSSEAVFFADWDQRFRATAETCEVRHPQAYSALGRLRFRVEASLSQHRDHEAALVDEINAGIGSPTSTSP